MFGNKKIELEFRINLLGRQGFHTYTHASVGNNWVPEELR
jgi:hypothetical protein